MREIKGYEGLYAVDADGRVFNLRTGKEKKPTIGNHGYLAVDLFKNGQRKTLLVHRLVAEAFIPNPHKKRTVNHKDGNKLNNRISNLEWATHSENHKHSFRKLGRTSYMTGRFGHLNHNSKPILQCSLNGDVIQRFDSIHCAERATGILNNAICACLRGRARTSGGYKWRYEDDTGN